MAEPEKKSGKAFIRAVPWTTPTEDRVKGALGEIPAYARRAKRTEDAIRRLFATTRAEREDRLLFVALRLRRHLDSLPEGTTPASAIREVLAAVESGESFRRLAPRPGRSRASPETTRAALAESVRRFNRRWRAWIAEEAPLDATNREIEGYNRHYMVERQAALKYVPFDELRFEKKALLDEEDLLSEFPPLPVP